MCNGIEFLNLKNCKIMSNVFRIVICNKESENQTKDFLCLKKIKGIT